MPGLTPGDRRRSVSAPSGRLRISRPSGNKPVVFLCGDVSVARSGYGIQLEGYVFERTLGGLEPFHQFLEGHSPRAPLLL